MFAATASYAREVIHAFNEQGFAALDPKWSGGRPRRFGPQLRETICRVAKTAPAQLGLPFTTWSLTKIVEHLREAERITVSTETVRTVLGKAGISRQATNTWKGSRDPDFAAKKARILELYDQAAAGGLPDGGRVVCVDEFGPLNLQPARAGAGSRAGDRSGSGPRTPAPAGSGTCSRRWTWPRGRCSTGSGTASAGRSSSRSCASCAPGSHADGCLWCATTSPRTARPRSPRGAPI